MPDASSSASNQAYDPYKGGWTAKSHPSFLQNVYVGARPATPEDVEPIFTSCPRCEHCWQTGIMFPVKSG